MRESVRSVLRSGQIAESQLANSKREPLVLSYWPLAKPKIKTNPFLAADPRQAGTGYAEDAENRNLTTDYTDDTD